MIYELNKLQKGAIDILTRNGFTEFAAKVEQSWRSGEPYSAYDRTEGELLDQALVEAEEGNRQ